MKSLFPRWFAKNARLGELQAVLFDLDGTLLQVSMEAFIPAYIDGLGRHLADLVAPQHFAASAQKAVGSLFAPRGGDRSNEDQFQAVIEAECGLPGGAYRRRLQRFVDDGLAELAYLVRPVPSARELVLGCHAAGFKLALATNPVFPEPVIRARMAWAGLADLPFAAISSYETSRHCKPDPCYYRALAQTLGVDPAACLMVGNDSWFDMGAREAGMLTYLVDTYLVERRPARWAPDFRGDHGQLRRFLHPLRPGRRN